ncbi:hypothetical protein BDF21DRAFT_392704 [Thamnidium elegans]|nr:hypothetical protein BDF21DRAFT_392704 [Thamnidium elegans]
MDNAPIHKPAAIRERIEKFWSKVKAGIKRNPLGSGDLLTPRIMNSVIKVTLSDCCDLIRHSFSFFSRDIYKLYIFSLITI